MRSTLIERKPAARAASITVRVCCSGWMRLTARWTCGSCGAIWNTEFKPPAKAGVCDTCGGALQQRSDDRPEAVTARLEVYTRQTAPLLDYYRSQGVLHDVDADRPPSDILADLARMISDPDRSPSSRSR